MQIKTFHLGICKAEAGPRVHEKAACPEGLLEGRLGHLDYFKWLKMPQVMKLSSLNLDQWMETRPG